MSLEQALSLTRVGDMPVGLVRLGLRPEWAYKVSGRTWGKSTADLSFAVYNSRVATGQFLDVTSAIIKPNGTTGFVTETLVYVKQDEFLPSKGEWGIHYFIKLDSLGKESEIVHRGKEVVFWKLSDERKIASHETRLAREKAWEALQRRLSA